MLFKALHSSKIQWNSIASHQYTTGQIFQKVLENVTLEIWARFRAFYNVCGTSEYFLTICKIGNQLGTQIKQELGRPLPEIRVCSLFC